MEAIRDAQASAKRNKTKKKNNGARFDSPTKQPSRRKRQQSGKDRLLELASAKQSREMNNDSYPIRIQPRTTAHTRPPRTHACTHREAHEKKDKKEKKKGNQ